MMIRRDAFDLAGGFDERYFLYWEDADLCRRLRNLGWATAYVPQAVVVHHGGRSSRSRLAPLSSFHVSAFRYFVAHASPLARLAAPLVATLLALRFVFKVVIRSLPLRNSS
jgi:GT2 family glycosyltransferase